MYKSNDIPLIPTLYNFFNNIQLSNVSKSFFKSIDTVKHLYLLSNLL